MEKCGCEFPYCANRPDCVLPTLEPGWKDGKWRRLSPSEGGIEHRLPGSTGQDRGAVLDHREEDPPLTGGARISPPSSSEMPDG